MSKAAVRSLVKQIVPQPFHRLGRQTHYKMSAETANNTTSDTAQPNAKQRVATLRRWKRAIRASQVVVAFAVFASVWAIGFRTDDGPAPVVPDTTSQFSLDLKVVASADHDVIYAVEQRARPFYRILAFDPTSGEVQTVYTVPEDAIIYGIALSPDRNTLAVSYSTDFAVNGNGLWELDLSSGDLSPIVAEQADRYLVDPSWSPDGSSVFVTHVDRSGEQEQLNIAEIDSEGTITMRATDGVDPAVDGDRLYYLDVGADNARRSIGVVDHDGVQTVVDFEDREFDLDHLVSANGLTQVAVLDPIQDDSGVTLGTTAEAHGDHNVRSTWWRVEVTSEVSAVATALAPIIVYDAAATSEGTIVYATLEGLSVGDDERVDLIASRAIRFVAG